MDGFILVANWCDGVRMQWLYGIIYMVKWWYGTMIWIFQYFFMVVWCNGFCIVLQILQQCNGDSFVLSHIFIDGDMEKMVFHEYGEIAKKNSMVNKFYGET